MNPNGGKFLGIFTKSAAIYAYLVAVCLYHADKENNSQKISSLMENVPNLTRKIAGKSIPFEVFFVIF